MGISEYFPSKEEDFKEEELDIKYLNIEMIGISKNNMYIPWLYIHGWSTLNFKKRFLTPKYDSDGMIPKIEFMEKIVASFHLKLIKINHISV